MNKVCTYCKSSRIDTVDTYKHNWHVCGDCFNAYREKKEKLFWDNPITQGLFRKSKLRHVYGHTLLYRKDVIGDKTKAYDYYVQSLEKGFQGTKWETAPERIVKNAEKHGLEVQGKRVLDISGGPGHLSSYLKNKASQVVCTELSEPSVEAMKKTLGIEAVVFDYNAHSIHEVVDGPFDTIFINYSIGYCNDLRAFASSLKKVMHKDSQLYLAYSPPSLGLFLRWQMADYPYTRCWQYETISKVFAEIGMKEVVREDESQQYYNENQWVYHEFSGNTLMGLIRQTASHYKRKASHSKARFNRDLYQKNIRQMFKFQWY